MKIEAITVENWRSFYGKHQIVLSTDPEKNVTLIRAENGSGKTNLLAALNWCLFAILPPSSDFGNPKNLLNDHAKLHDNATHVRVDLEFEHKGKVYKASRTYDQPNERTNALRLVEIRDGAETPMPSTTNADRFINAVLPREMAPHFFFYGEATSNYTNATGAQAFGAAVKNILGATAASMALSDLEKVFREYEKEAANSTPGDAINYQVQIDKIEDQKKELEDALVSAKTEEEAAEAVVEKIHKQLLGSEKVRDDQLRRDRLTSDLKSYKSRLDKSVAEGKRWFDQFGTSLLAQSFVFDVQDLLDKEDTRRKIPGDFNKKFVNEVLEDELCICGRPLKHGTEEEANVKSLLNTATDRTMVDRVMSTQAALGKLKAQAKMGWPTFTKSNEEQKRLQNSIEVTDTELEEISARLRTNDIKSIAEKEDARTSAKAKQRTAIEKQVQIINKQKDNERRVAQLRGDQSKLLRDSIAAQRYVKRVQVAGALVAELRRRLDDEELFARLEIKRKIDKIASEFMRKSFRVEIDRNYRVTVKNEHSNNAALSEGEKLLFGLAFTGAIAEFARDRQSEDVDILLSGTDAPLVIDAPFGDLDETYRAAVASFLPKMAPQVILLLSSSHTQGSVIDVIADKIDRQYVMRRFEQDEAGDRKIDSVSIDGKVIQLTQYGQEFTGTVVQEVV